MTNSNEDESEHCGLINVKLFASARELIGRDKITLQSTNQMTVGALRKMILKLYPVLSISVQYVVAVNHEIADEFTSIDEEDEIAILPPVSGG